MMKKRRVDVWMHKGRYIYIYGAVPTRCILTTLLYYLFLLYVYDPDVYYCGDNG